jgi:hypothetical protein
VLKAPQPTLGQRTTVTSNSRIRYSTVKLHRFRPCGRPLKEKRRRKTFVKRLLYLAMVALVALLILVPTAVAQEQTKMVEQKVKVEGTAPLPPSGGPSIGLGAVALPAVALLIGAGVLGYAVLRRR